MASCDHFEEEVDVAIIGAGPAGLSTALAISKAAPNLKVHVYERATALRPSGGSIGLSNQNAFRAFDALGDGVLDTVRGHGYERRSMTRTDHLGNDPVVVHPPSTIIAWYELQKALLACLPNETMVTLACEVDRIDDDEDMPVVHMRDGRSVRARVVVGADGNSSACRSYVQGATEAEYVGAVVWRFFVPGDNPFVEVSDTLALTGGGKVMVLQPVKRDGEVLTYCAGISSYDKESLAKVVQTRYVQSEGEDTDSLGAKLGRFAEALKDFKADVLQYVLDKAVPESVLEHPMYSLDPNNAWSKGRVVLVGDSAHVMPPNLGQGTTMAIEDAVQLGFSIKEGGLTEESLAEYERVRKERVIPISDVSTQEARAFYQEQDTGANPLKPSDKLKEMFAFVNAYEPPNLDPAA